MASTLVSVGEYFNPEKLPVEIQCLTCQNYFIVEVPERIGDATLRCCCDLVYGVEAEGFTAFWLSVWRETADPVPIGLTLGGGLVVRPSAPMLYTFDQIEEGH